MREVMLGMNVTLDGIVAGPDGELDWMFATMAPELQDSIVAGLRQVDTILIGAHTYAEQAAFWPQQQGEMADLLNAATKVVFSSTDTGLDWQNSRLATGKPAEEVKDLTGMPGGTIFVTGGAELARTMAEQDLIDEYRLAIHPVLLGHGKPLFGPRAGRKSLKLVDTRAYDTGTIEVTYRAS